MLIHTDCRYYRGSMPCIFHKKEGRLCDGCADYVHIKTRILVIKLAAIGDVLRTTSILPALHQKYPGAEITWITKVNAAPLLAGNPLIDRVLAVEENYLEFLQNESFSVGICLDADPHSATLHSLARCQERFGFVANPAGKVTPVNDAAVNWWLLGLNDSLKKRNRKTYQELMYEICGLPSPTFRPQLHLNGIEDQISRRIFENPSLRNATSIIGINTGGGGRWQHKKWTLEGYVGCVNLLKERCPGIGLLLLGGPEETELNKLILSEVGDKVVDGGCLNPLMRFASLVQNVDALLTSDSLAMHVGVALEKPTFVLVGPTSPWELDVFGKGAILHSDIECLCCYLSRCDKKVHCMNTLAPDWVVSKIFEFFENCFENHRRPVALNSHSH